MQNGKNDNNQNERFQKQWVNTYIENWLISSIRNTCWLIIIWQWTLSIFSSSWAVFQTLFEPSPRKRLKLLLNISITPPAYAQNSEIVFRSFLNPKSLNMVWSWFIRLFLYIIFSCKTLINRLVRTSHFQCFVQSFLFEWISQMEWNVRECWKYYFIVLFLYYLDEKTFVDIKTPTITIIVII